MNRLVRRQKLRAEDVSDAEVGPRRFVFRASALVVWGQHRICDRITLNRAECREWVLIGLGLSQRIRAKADSQIALLSLVEGLITAKSRFDLETGVHVALLRKRLHPWHR